MAKNVVVYHQPGCPPCHTAMEYLSQRGIPFVAKNVQEDEDAMRELIEDYRSQSTPTIVVDGQVMIGLDRKRLDAMLN